MDARGCVKSREKGGKIDMATRGPNAKGPIAPSTAQLGASLESWNALLEFLSTRVAGAETVWKHYAGATGTQCVIRVKKRNVAYLKPMDGSFLFSVALSQDAVTGLVAAKLPKALVAEIVAAPVSPEGRPARVRVNSAKSLKTALALLAIKLEHMGL